MKFGPGLESHLFCFFLYLQNGWTPLHFASKAGFLNVVTLLIESGASPKFETKVRCLAEMPSPLAIEHCYKRTHWANPMNEIHLESHFVFLSNQDGRVAICYAAMANHLAVLSFLMKKDHNTQHLMEDRKVTAHSYILPLLNRFSFFPCPFSFHKCVINATVSWPWNNPQHSQQLPWCPVLLLSDPLQSSITNWLIACPLPEKNQERSLSLV